MGRRVLAVAIAAALAAAIVWAIRATGRGQGDGGEVAARLTVAAALAGGGGDTEGYARAIEPRSFEFPADHGPHPGFRTEWWYFTGNLAGEDGRRFGYQLTFFRNRLAPLPPPAADAPPARSSAWAAAEVWFAHFAVTRGAGGGDGGGERFHAFERWQRGGALGLAGARTEPFRVWVGPWSAAGDPAGGLFPLRLSAAAGGEEGEAAIDLVLTAAKPPVLQGDRGLSRKGREPGNASYYYSLTRLETAGAVTVDGRSFRVAGASWLDREWSTSALEAGQVGWDWFALQLADGRELMLYQLRRADGTPDPLSSGSLVAADGGARTLAAGEFAIEVLDRWRSPRTGVRYPSRWRLRVPAAAIDVVATPLVAGQELDLSVRYWEGAVRVEGSAAGYGYAELTGYGE